MTDARTFTKVTVHFEYRYTKGARAFQNETNLFECRQMNGARSVPKRILSH